MNKHIFTILFLVFFAQAASFAQMVNLAGYGEQNYFERFEKLKKTYYYLSGPVYIAIYQELNNLAPTFQKRVTPEQLTEIVDGLRNIQNRHETNDLFNNFLRDLEEELKDPKIVQHEVDSFPIGKIISLTGIGLIILIIVIFLIKNKEPTTQKAPRNELQKKTSIPTKQKSPQTWKPSLLEFMKKSQNDPFSQSFKDSTTPKSKKTGNEPLVEFMKKSQNDPFAGPQQIQGLENEIQRLLKEVTAKNTRIAPT